MRGWTAGFVLLSCATVVSGCRFREPEPSEAVYSAAVAPVAPRPEGHLVTRKGAPEPMEAALPKNTAPRPPSGDADFQAAVAVGGVAFRPPADLFVSLQDGGLLGALGGRCVHITAGGVPFPCDGLHAQTVTRWLPLAKARAAELNRAVPWERLAGPVAGATQLVEAPARQGLCARSTGGPASAGQPGGIGDAIRGLTDRADALRAQTDDAAGVVLDRLADGWQVCLVLAPGSPTVAGAAPLPGGTFARSWHRGSYATVLTRESAARTFAGAQGRAPTGLVRVTLFHDPEAMAADQLVSAVDVQLR